jgi:glucose-6-phosphate 1-dehydrogenase
MVIALGAMEMGQDETMAAKKVEIVASSHASPREMEAYERILGDALIGDATHFAREDYVEEAWRIVDPVLKEETPVYEYPKGSWGPSEVDHKVTPAEGWHNPAPAAQLTAEIK